jgi:hypothetical protein
LKDAISVAVPRKFPNVGFEYYPSLIIRSILPTLVSLAQHG